MVKSVDEMNKTEKEELLEIITIDLKAILSEERYLHSISTMKKAKEIAKAHHYDEQIAMLTALAHDIAKEMTNEEYYTYAKENNIPLDEFDYLNVIALHGKVGAHIAWKKYGFTKEMQDAIYYHTTGRANMTLLDKIIYLADKLEDRRNYNEVEELRKIYKDSNNLDKTILWDIDNDTIPKRIEKQKLIHPNSIYARNDILAKNSK